MKLKLNKANDEKLRQLILYIAELSEGDEPFGYTKLNKLLFYCDFLAYLNFGKSITGHEYQKLENGPAPRQMVPIVRDMEERGLLKMRQESYYGKSLVRALALEEADLEAFTG